MINYLLSWFKPAKTIVLIGDCSSEEHKVRNSSNGNYIMRISTLRSGIYFLKDDDTVVPSDIYTNWIPLNNWSDKELKKFNL